MDCKIWKSNIREWIKVTGEDSEDYLQSQFSQDLRPLKEGDSTYGLFLGLKGKVRADGFVVKFGKESYGIISYFCDANELISIIEENVIADDVEFEKIPVKESFVIQSSNPIEIFPDAIVFPGRWMKEEHYDVLPQNGDASNDDSHSFGELESLRIQNGIIAVPKDIGPNELPQEGGLEEVAVSFNKGCFLGQEVMARLKAMGKVQRRIYQVSGNGKLPEPGSAVLCEEKTAGELKSVTQCSNDDSWIGLALLRWKIVEEHKASAWSVAENSHITILEIA